LREGGWCAILDDQQRSRQQHPIRRQARHFHDHSNADRLPQEASDIFWLLGKLAQVEPCPEEKRSTQSVI